MGMRLASAEWSQYSELNLDPHSDSFTVVLNEAGTRMLRSWRHMEDVCPQCGTAATEELFVDDIVHIGGGTRSDPPSA